MCYVSMVGDGWRDQFPKKYPKFVPGDGFFHNFPNIPEEWRKITPGYPNLAPVDITTPIAPDVITREEFDSLKKEVEALRELLKAAKEFDKATNQNNCEMDEKVALIKQVADMVGVDLGDVFGK